MGWGGGKRLIPQLEFVSRWGNFWQHKAAEGLTWPSVKGDLPGLGPGKGALPGSCKGVLPWPRQVEPTGPSSKGAQAQAKGDLPGPGKGALPGPDKGGGPYQTQTRGGGPYLALWQARLTMEYIIQWQSYYTEGRLQRNYLLVTG